MRTKSTVRLALSGVAFLVAAGVAAIVTTIASAAEYNATEDSGAAVGTPSIGIYVGVGLSAVLLAVGAALVVASIVTAVRSRSRVPETAGV